MVKEKEVYTKEMTPLKERDYVRTQKEAIAEDILPNYKPYFSSAILQNSASTTIFTCPSNYYFHITCFTFTASCVTGFGGNSCSVKVNNSSSDRLGFMYINPGDTNTITINFNPSFIVNPGETIQMDCLGAGLKSFATFSGYLKPTF